MAPNANVKEICLLVQVRLWKRRRLVRLNLSADDLNYTIGTESNIQTYHLCKYVEKKITKKKLCGTPTSNIVPQHSYVHQRPLSSKWWNSVSTIL